MTSPTIAVLPYGGRLGPKIASRPLDDLVWPLGRPARLARGVVGDLTPEDHLIVFPKTEMHYQWRFGTAAKVSMMVVEPKIIHARHLSLLRLTHRRFFRVLSFHEDLLSRIPNGVFLPYGTTWVPEYASLDVTKTKTVSLIASGKRDAEGHRLRHEIVERVLEKGLELDVLGRGYAPFEQKSEGLAPYRYSVVIENARERNYFTEKLVDAVLCETVPIYWGCPNISDFIDPGAMVICDSAEEIMTAIEGASDEGYAVRLAALVAAKPQAAAFDNLERRAAEALAASL